MYETTIPGGVTENAFRPQLYIDITETLETKTNALNCFDTQKIRCGDLWIDSIVGRSLYRGYQMNTKYAEAFEIIKVTKW
jgi:LmbE family N-acetylglucosaminyl deacetylase